MITWITGNSGSGKSTMARELATRSERPAVVLDGDAMRAVWPGLGLDEAGRREQNWRVARLARIIELQGLDVVVATICPYRDQRQQIKDLTKCNFVYLKGGKTGPDYPYEEGGPDYAE